MSFRGNNWQWDNCAPNEHRLSSVRGYTAVSISSTGSQFDQISSSCRPSSNTPSWLSTLKNEGWGFQRGCSAGIVGFSTLRAWRTD